MQNARIRPVTKALAKRRTTMSSVCSRTGISRTCSGDNNALAKRCTANEQCLPGTPGQPNPGPPGQWRQQCTERRTANEQCLPGTPGQPNPGNSRTVETTVHWLNAAQLMSSVCRELPDDSPGTPGRPSNSMAATDPVSTEAALSRGLSREECYRSPATARPLRQWQPQPLVCMNAPEIIWRTPRPRGGTLLGVWEPIPK